MKVILLRNQQAATGGPYAATTRQGRHDTSVVWGVKALFNPPSPFPLVSESMTCEGFVRWPDKTVRDALVRD